MLHLNLFRVLGDLLHILSFAILIHKIHQSRSIAGISLRTQELYLTVFSLRYLDLFWTFNYAYYNTVLKIAFICASGYIVYLMRTKYKATLVPETVRVALLVGPCFALALIFNEAFTVVEVLWATSIYLEAVAIVPQLLLLQRTGEVEVMTSHYVAALGGYRALYLFNWIYRLMTEDDYSSWIVWISGVIQTGIYVDFFYYYLKSIREGKRIQLPL